MSVERADPPRVAVYPPGAVLTRQPIDDHEFVWMLQGTATLRAADGNTSVPPGTLLLLPPGVAHTLVWDPTRTSTHGYVHFDVAGPAEPGPRRPLLHAMGAGDPAAALCRFLLDLGRRPGASQGVVAATIRVLLDVVLTPSADAAARPPAIALAAAHLRAAWAQMPLRRVPVAELATAAHLSTSQLARVFGDWFGAAPAEVLEQARLERAEQLLLRSDLAVAAVARACAFADAAHLTHRFRTAYGMPPGRFRRNGAASSTAPRSERLVELFDALWS